MKPSQIQIYSLEGYGALWVCIAQSEVAADWELHQYNYANLRRKGLSCSLAAGFFGLGFLFLGFRV